MSGWTEALLVDGSRPAWLEFVDSVVPRQVGGLHVASDYDAWFVPVFAVFAVSLVKQIRGWRGSARKDAASDSDAPKTNWLEAQTLRSFILLCVLAWALIVAFLLACFYGWQTMDTHVRMERKHQFCKREPEAPFCPGFCKHAPRAWFCNASHQVSPVRWVKWLKSVHCARQVFLSHDGKQYGWLPFCNQQLGVLDVLMDSWKLLLKKSKGSLQKRCTLGAWTLVCMYVYPRQWNALTTATAAAIFSCGLRRAQMRASASSAYMFVVLFTLLWCALTLVAAQSNAPESRPTKPASAEAAATGDVLTCGQATAT